MNLVSNPAVNAAHTAKKLTKSDLSFGPNGDRGEFGDMFSSMQMDLQGQGLAAKTGKASPPAEGLASEVLGPAVHIITSTTATMNDESLFAFARSQGMDESSLALIFQHAAPAASPIETSDMADPSPLISLDVPSKLGKQALVVQAAFTDNAIAATSLATASTVVPAAPLEPKTDADGMSVLDLGADGSLRWSVNQAGQLNAAETKKDTLAFADASAKPVYETRIELSTAAFNDSTLPATPLATTAAVVPATPIATTATVVPATPLATTATVVPATPLATTATVVPATPLATAATVVPATPPEPKTDADGMSVLDLSADGSLRWSVNQAGQLNATETKKDTSALADASVKPVHQTGIELSTTAVQQQSKQAPAENLAATLILGASEAAQFAKRVQTKQVNLHTEKNAALTGESFKSSAAKIEPSSISAIDDTSAVADTLSLGTELTGEDLRMMWEHRQHSSANNNANSDSGMGSSTGQTNAPQSDIDLRADQYQKLSQRLGEALGQRLAAQIARGDWNVELTLKPQDLGNIEIKLDMKQGNLEASFNASEAMTRDLIVDGLPRLKETLTQSGMEVAQLSVSTRQYGQNGGNSTPGRQKTPNAISGVSKSSAVTTGEPTASLTAKKSTADNNGLDILV